MKSSSRVKRVEESATLKVNELAKKLGAEGARVFNFGIGELSFDTPERIKKEIVKHLDQNKLTPTMGLPLLRKEIAQKLSKKYGSNFTLENVGVTTGAKSGLFYLFAALLDPKDEVVIPAPYWGTYLEQIKLWNGVPKVAETTTEFDLDIGAIKKAITPRTKAILLNSPNNPTGKVYSAPKLKELAKLIKNTEIKIIFDAIYDELIFDQNLLSQNNIYRYFPASQIILIHGFSKSYALTGWRIGYLAADEEIIKMINKVQSQGSGNVSVLSQYGALAALKNPKIPQAFNQNLKKNRQIAFQYLKNIKHIKLAMPDGAFYFFIDISKIERDAVKFCDKLLKETHVALAPGDAFGRQGFVRLSYGVNEKILKAGLEKLVEFINTYANQK